HSRLTPARDQVATPLASGDLPRWADAPRRGRAGRVTYRSGRGRAGALPRRRRRLRQPLCRGPDLPGCPASGGRRGEPGDRRLGRPRDRGAVARVVIGGQVRRLDLSRTDAGSVTLHGALLGGATGDGQAVAWHGRVDVDDACLSDGNEPILACAVVNAGASAVDGLPLVVAADPGDGRLA